MGKEKLSLSEIENAQRALKCDPGITAALDKPIYQIINEIPERLRVLDEGSITSYNKVQSWLCAYLQNEKRKNDDLIQANPGINSSDDKKKTSPAEGASDSALVPANSEEDLSLRVKDEEGRKEKMEHARGSKVFKEYEAVLRQLIEQPTDYDEEKLEELKERLNAVLPTEPTQWNTFDTKDDSLREHVEDKVRDDGSELKYDTVTIAHVRLLRDYIEDELRRLNEGLNQYRYWLNKLSTCLQKLSGRLSHIHKVKANLNLTQFNAELDLVHVRFKELSDLYKDCSNLDTQVSQETADAKSFFDLVNSFSIEKKLEVSKISSILDKAKNGRKGFQTQYGKSISELLDFVADLRQNNNDWKREYCLDNALKPKDFNQQLGGFEDYSVTLRDIWKFLEDIKASLKPPQVKNTQNKGKDARGDR